MKNVFIINPKAGKRSSAERLTQQIEQICGQNGIPYEICVTQKKGEGTEIARRFAQSGEEVRVFACGGDGSAFDVLNGIAGYENAAMGIIPCGTGNDFLKYFETTAPFSSVEAQLDGIEYRLDVIRCGERYCLNQASMGLDAQVCAHKDKFNRLPFVGGQLAYVLALLYCFFSAIKNRFTVQIDQHPEIEGDFLLAVAANGRFYGGGFESAPLARTDDGLLECMAVQSVSRLRILSLLKKYEKGQHLNLPICHYRQGKVMRVASRKPTVVNLDGEVFDGTQAKFEILPAFVRFVLPKGCSVPRVGQEKPKETVHK